MAQEKGIFPLRSTNAVRLPVGRALSSSLADFANLKEVTSSTLLPKFA